MGIPKMDDGWMVYIWKKNINWWWLGVALWLRKAPYGGKKHPAISTSYDWGTLGTRVLTHSQILDESWRMGEDLNFGGLRVPLCWRMLFGLWKRERSTETLTESEVQPQPFGLSEVVDFRSLNWPQNWWVKTPTSTDTSHHQKCKKMIKMRNHRRDSWYSHYTPTISI